MAGRSRARLWAVFAAFAALAGAIGTIFSAVNSGWDVWDRVWGKGGPPTPAPVPAKVADAGFPFWHVGDRWAVQTRPHEPGGPAPQEWRFHVSGKEHLPAGECFKLDIAALLDGTERPAAVLWVGGEPLALRQAQLVVRGGARRLTEQYRYPAGHAAVLPAPLAGVPVAFPAGLRDGLDATGRCFVQPGAGPEFLVETETKQRRVEPDVLRQALGGDPPGGPSSAPVIEVRVVGPGSPDLRLLWREGDPWPAFADNGVVTARLSRLPASLP
jgi:hypothetical protein